MGFDWLTLEMEHTPMTLETAAASFSIISNSGVAPLVRVPMNTVENIKRVLDTGAWGIVVPMVNSRAECEAVVEAARYRPIGRRTIGGSLHAANFDTDAATYYAKANDEILIVIMAEHVDAIERADEIFSVPELMRCSSAQMILHASMGLAAQLRQHQQAIPRRRRTRFEDGEEAQHRPRHSRRRCSRRPKSASRKVFSSSPLPAMRAS
jgi:2-keto-3-deoxy-L-rhamnonate aldolase RhmA